MKRPAQLQFTLTCPECSAESRFAAAVLVPGRKLPCPHCGIELTVSHDRDTPDGPPVWRLEPPEPEQPRSREA